MADLITQADVEMRIGPLGLVQVLDDDGDGIAEPDNVTWMLATASGIAKGILAKAFTSEAIIEALVAADPAIKNAVVEIAAGLAGGRRQGYLGPEGKTPYSGWQSRAVKYLKEVAAAEVRSIGELTVQKNQTLNVSVTPDRPTVFAATADNPTGPGGF